MKALPALFATFVLAAALPACAGGEPASPALTAAPATRALTAAVAVLGGLSLL